MNENNQTLLNISNTNTNLSQNSNFTHEITTGVILEIVILAHIEVLVLLGNLLVMLAFFKGPRRIRTITNYFVVNLAVSDLMVGCLSIPFWIALRLGKAPASAIKYFAPLDVLFGTASIFSLAAISMERLYAVRKPAEHFNLSRKPVYICIAFTWVVGIIVTTINITLYSKTGKVTTLLIFVLAFLLPLIIIIASYIVIFTTAYNMTKADNQMNNMSKELRIAKTISVIIGLFVICWAPFFAINLSYVFCETCFSSWDAPISITKALHYGNSMMNVFVYAVRSPEYRQTFKALITKCNTVEVRGRLRTMSFQPLRRRSTDKSRLNNNEENSTSTEYKLRYDNSKLLHVDI